MVAITDTNIITKVSKDTTSIRTGIIDEDTKPGMLLLLDTSVEDEPIMQLQFNTIRDIEYIQIKLEELKKQMKTAREI